MNFSKYIGLKYKLKGRESSGLDCYGLVYLIYKEEKGIVLPDFNSIQYCDTWYEKGEHHITDGIEKIWNIGKEIKKPYKPYDVMFFYSSPSKTVVNHCGLFIEDNKFIHIYPHEKSYSEIARFSGYWESKLYKVIRYKGDV